MSNTNIELIKIFGVAVSAPAQSTQTLPFATLNREAVKKGYIIHPDACTESVKEFIDQVNTDYNSTFYKTFKDVTSRSQYELFIDQVFHYVSTYGTNFTEEAYVANENCKDTHKFVFDKYTVITAVTAEEMCKKCLDLLYSGIALKQETSYACIDFLYNSVSHNNFDVSNINFDEIKNREALIMMCDKFGKYPNNAMSLFRYIVYKTTGETLIIKNAKLIELIKYNAHLFDFSKLSDEQLIQLSTVFFRFKPLFLAYKTDANNKSIINRIRRLAKTHHEPMNVGLFEKFLNNVSLKSYASNTKLSDFLTRKITAEAEACTNFKLIRLLQLIAEKTVILVDCLEHAGAAEVKNMYVIRNGKVFFKNDVHTYTKHEIVNIISTLGDIRNILYNKLVENIKNNISKDKEATYIPINELELACPVSEKNFVGNYPNGSRYKLSPINIFGIYWRNEWGTRDFDLSFCDKNGKVFAWNGRYTHDDNIVYSGDMTNADPCATECIRFSNEIENGVFSINRYNGYEGSKFEFFMSQSNEFDRNNQNYMVDPNSIVFKSDCISDKSQKMLGVICNGYMYLNNLSVGNSIVADFKHASISDIYNIYVLKSQTTLMLYNVLEAAGYKKIADEEKTEDTIDFRTMTKADIIKLFS